MGQGRKLPQRASMIDAPRPEVIDSRVYYGNPRNKHLIVRRDETRNMGKRRVYANRPQAVSRIGSGATGLLNAGTRNNYGGAQSLRSSSSVGGPSCGPRPTARLCPPMETIDPDDIAQFAGLQRASFECSGHGSLAPLLSFVAPGSPPFAPRRSCLHRTRPSPSGFYTQGASKHPHTTSTTRISYGRSGMNGIIG